MKVLEENKPSVSVIIHCYKKKLIDQCLDSTIAQDYPKDKLKSLFMDRMSDNRVYRRKNFSL